MLNGCFRCIYIIIFCIDGTGHCMQKCSVAHNFFSFLQVFQLLKIQVLCIKMSKFLSINLITENEWEKIGEKGKVNEREGERNAFNPHYHGITSSLNAIGYDATWFKNSNHWNVVSTFRFDHNIYTRKYMRKYNRTIYRTMVLLFMITVGNNVSIMNIFYLQLEA